MGRPLTGSGFQLDGTGSTPQPSCASQTRPLGTPGSASHCPPQATSCICVFSKLALTRTTAYLPGRGGQSSLIKYKKTLKDLVALENSADAHPGRSRRPLRDLPPANSFKSTALRCPQPSRCQHSSRYSRASQVQHGYGKATKTRFAENDFVWPTTTSTDLRALYQIWRPINSPGGDAELLRRSSWNYPRLEKSAAPVRDGASQLRTGLDWKTA